jgi:hypothetical protein
VAVKNYLLLPFLHTVARHMLLQKEKEVIPFHLWQLHVLQPPFAREAPCFLVGVSW